MIFIGKHPPAAQDVIWFCTADGMLYTTDGEKWIRIPPEPTPWQRVCRFLFGWWIGNYWANKNDRLMAVFIAYMMNDWEITETMLARKRELWAKCEWWGRVR